ncbi:uncharacterized protein LOC106422541 [Brassica napus]|uniref:uncharacterized protein LOC106422541 n=1 Tax=Brassica napus TaxID=3708 RepID=UPI00207A1B28|nr:uncharacterized protein LOC106422541 [Brassica napus]
MGYYTLSPYIFILCTEVLSELCDKALSDGTLSGVCVSRASPAIDHLLFADDTMFFCKSNTASVRQHINFAKTAITFSARTPPEVKSRVKTALSIEAEGGIGKYLGLPELFGRKKRDIFAAILDRIRQRTLSWTTNFLSGAGKQVLLKAVLAAMPCYAMSCFKLPKSLCKQIQSMLTRFWWDANSTKKKMCWVAWSTLTQPKHAGGLRFRDIEMFNDALLAKIGWRILSKPQSLVARVLLGRYARNSTFMDCPVSASSSHGWKSILAGREILRMSFSWSVGNGESIRVWHDPWLSCETPLIPIGPPTLAASNLLVSDLLCKLTNTWDRDKIRQELPQYDDAILCIFTSSAPSEDQVAWVYEKYGAYSTRSGYGIGMSAVRPVAFIPVPFDWRKNIWNVNTAPKIKDFLWKVVKKAIPVSANLASRGISSFPCKTCNDVEDDLHVFLLCSVAKEVWELAPISWTQLPMISSLGVFISSCASIKNLPPTGARNKRCFEDKAYSSMEILNKYISNARKWQGAQMLTTPPTKDVHELSRGKSVPQLPSPSTTMITCHVDAAWDANSGNCGLGGVFTGPPSTTHLRQLCESRPFVFFALMAEALAVRLAVMTAACANIKSLLILSDSLDLVKLLIKKESRPALFGIVFDIYYFTSLFDVISFAHVPRLNNCEADFVARSALASIVVTSVGGE